MTEQFPASLAPILSGASIARTHQELERIFRREGLVVANSRFAAALELSLSGGSLDSASPRLAGEIEVQRIEDDPIVSRSVPKPTSPSRLQYFLDGAQFTYPVYRVEHIPIYRTISAAAILHRNDRGEASILPGSLRVFRAWIMPTQQIPEQLTRVLEIFDSFGDTVLDPLVQSTAPENYARSLLDYGEIERASFRSAGNARADMERDLLGWWQGSNRGDGWIVVDGALRSPVENAVGLVKSITYQHLTGEESIHLFGLRAGHRTSAFVPETRRTRSAPSDAERLLWYLRMREAEGHDARYGLVRIEVAGERRDTELIDQLSGWLLDERAPRATSDERSDTLLYPIHLLERMLKRHIASETRGWPGAR
ncbi:hypothetical protein BH09CHL1_BH09CHL1_12080 [soil metagenome]